LVECPAILQELIIFIEAVHKQNKEKFSLVSLFKGFVLERMNVHGECHLNHCFFLGVFLLILIVSAYQITVVLVGHVGKPHKVSIGVYVVVGFGAIYESLFEILGMQFLINGVSGDLVDLISFGGVKGFDELGGLHFSALAALEVVDVLVLHVEVEGGVA
jgi:hypothetical protein